MRRPRAPTVHLSNALTRRLPFYALVALLFMAVFSNLAPDPGSFRRPVWYYPGGRFYGDDLVMFLTGLAFAITLYRITRDSPDRSADADSEMVPAENPTLFKRLLSSGSPRGVDADVV